MSRYKIRNTHKLSVESHETRRLLAGEVTVDEAGVAAIEGTTEDDVVIVAQQGDRLRVVVNGEVEKIPISQVSRIEFLGLKGNDRFRNETQFVAIAFGAERTMIPSAAEMAATSCWEERAPIRWKAMKARTVSLADWDVID